MTSSPSRSIEHHVLVHAGDIQLTLIPTILDNGIFESLTRNTGGKPCQVILGPKKETLEQKRKVEMQPEELHKVEPDQAHCLGNL